MKTFLLIGLLVAAGLFYLGLKWLWDNIEIKNDVNNKEKNDE